MSTTASVPVATPPGSPGGDLARADSRREGAVRPSAAALTPVAARLVGMGVLLALCLHQTGALVEPGAPGGAVATGVACALAALALSVSGRLPITWRPLGGAATLLVLAGLIVLAAGVPLSALRPTRLGGTLDALGQALGALSSVHVPYAGSDLWVRRAVQLSSYAGLAGATALVFWPALGRRAVALSVGRRLLAVGVIVVVYAVGEVNLRGGAPGASGVVLFAGLAALLWLERVQRTVAVAAGLAVALAALVGLASVPALRRPPLVQINARHLSVAGGEGFNWNQSYGPLRWPRDGRIVLGVRSPIPDYWKAVALERFNGSEWVQGSVAAASRAVSGLPEAAVSEGATRTVTVTLGSLRTAEFIGAGTTTRIAGAPLQPVGGTSPGTFRTTAGELGRGESYRATVYTPHPDFQTLDASPSTAYPAGLAGDLQLSLPLGARAPVAVSFPAFGRGGTPVRVHGGASVAAALDGSPYAGAWRLARSLAGRAQTPAGLVAAVQGALGAGYGYSEEAPLRRYPLEAFLLSDRRGSCQHFSGAMALLLRMAGVPARVAAGFTSGRYDARRGVWTATDVDAHAWVEAYFSGIGWVVFDSTPRAAPARGGHGTPPPPAGRRRTRRSRSRPAPANVAGAARGPRPPRGAGHRGGVPAWALAAIAVLIAGAVLGAAISRRLGRRWLTNPGGAGTAEVARALRARGLEGDGLTLDRLAARVGGVPAAAGYLRALRELRFSSTSPALALDPYGRRALRGELVRGTRLRERLALLSAIPPGGGPPRLAGDAQVRRFRA